MERKGIITFKGNPLTLTGNEMRVGDKAPDFAVLNGRWDVVNWLIKQKQNPNLLLSRDIIEKAIII